MHGATLSIEYFYWLLMIVKLFLATWLLRKTFYYSSIFLFSHAALDIISLLNATQLSTNESSASYWLGTFNFILKPFILSGCIAAIYNDKILRNINIFLLSISLFAFVSLPFLFSIHIDLPIMTAGFGIYALSQFFILGDKLLEFKKDTFPLISALMLLIPETLIFFQSKYVYLLINIINIVYYICMFIFLCFCSKYINIVLARCDVISKDQESSQQNSNIEQSSR